MKKTKTRALTPGEFNALCGKRMNAADAVLKAAQRWFARRPAGWSARPAERLLSVKVATYRLAHASWREAVRDVKKANRVKR